MDTIDKRIILEGKNIYCCVPVWQGEGHLWFRQFRFLLQTCSQGGQLPSQH